MDPASFVASVLALAEATLAVVEYLHEVKEGGKQRFKLLAEVTSLWNVLDNLQKTLESLQTESEPSQRWMEVLVHLNDEGGAVKDAQSATAARQSSTGLGGPLAQCKSLVQDLTTKLLPKPGSSGKLLAALRWPFEKQEAQTVIDQVHRLQVSITLALGQANLMLSKQIYDDTSRSRTILEADQARKILEWISPLNFDSQQTAIYHEYCRGTGEWFLESSQFSRWFSTPDAVLWSAGMPGAGKTLLSSFIVHKLRSSLAPSPPDRFSKGDDSYKTSNVSTVGPPPDYVESEANIEGNDVARKNIARYSPHSLSKSQDNHRHICLVAFCRFDDPACQDVAQVLGALLKQTFDSADADVSPELIQRYADSQRTGARLDIETTTNLLASQLSKYDRVFVIIDALDELIATKNREVLVTELRRLQNTNLLIFSRELDEIREQLRPIENICDGCEAEEEEFLYHCDYCALPLGTIPGGFDACQHCHESGVSCPDKSHPPSRRVPNVLFVRIEANEDDLLRYVHWRISSDPGLGSLVRKKKGLQEEICSTILTSSQSMFLLAKLAVDNLATCLTIRDVKKSLLEVPEGLQTAYDRSMLRIDQQDRHRSRLGRQVLKWALTAWRPLTCAEMEQAIAVEPDMDELDFDDIVPASTLVSLCAGLLVVDHLNYVRWVHYTAEEYFRERADTLYPDAHSSMAHSCLTFILFDVFDTGPCLRQSEFLDREKMYPFYDYALRNWAHHSSYGGHSSDQALGISFLESEGHRGAAMQTIWDNERNWSNSPYLSEEMKPVPALYLSVHLGAEFAVRHFLSRHSGSLDMEDPLGQTPLSLATHRNYPSIVELLLEKGASVNYVARRSNAAAIHTAASSGHVRIMEILLRRPDIDVNITVRTQPLNYTPLMYAAQAGHVDIVQMLLDHPEVDLNHSVAKISSNALDVAVQNRRYGAANLILDSPMLRFDNDKESLRPAIFEAVKEGQVDLVEKLVARGANIEQKDPKGMTPVLLAAQRGEWPMILRKLLDLGANYRAVHDSGKTLLHYAAANAEMLRVCFDKKLDLDINARSKTGFTPLHQAVLWDRGSSESISMLVENGADISLRDFKNNMAPWNYCDSVRGRKSSHLLKLPNSTGDSQGAISSPVSLDSTVDQVSPNDGTPSQQEQAKFDSEGPLIVESVDEDPIGTSVHQRRQQSGSAVGLTRSSGKRRYVAQVRDLEYTSPVTSIL